MLPLPSREKIAASFTKVFAREMETAELVYLEHVPTPFYDELWIVVGSGVLSVAERCDLEVELQSVELADDQIERILLASRAVSMPAAHVNDPRTVVGGLQVAVYMADGDTFAINQLYALDADAELALKNSLRRLANALPLGQLTLSRRWLIHEVCRSEL